MLPMEICHCLLFMIFKAGVEKVQVGKNLINHDLVEQLAWPRAAGNSIFWVR